MTRCAIKATQRTVAPTDDEDPGDAFGWRFVAPVVIAASLNAVNSSLIATALVPISHALAIPTGHTTVLVAALYLASAIGQPTMGRLAEQIGARRVLVAGILILMAGGTLGGLLSSLTGLIVARVLVGLGTSAGYPTSVLLIHSRAREAGLGEPPGSVLGALSIAGQVTAAAGLPIGGLLVTLLGWRMTFLVNLPVGLLALGLTLTGIPAPTSDGAIVRYRGAFGLARAVDLIGIALFAVTISALLMFLLSLQHPRWAALAIAAAGSGAVVLWERQAEEPFLDVRSLAADLPLGVTYLRTGATFLGIYLVLYGVTQWLQEGRHLSAVQAGLVLAPMTAIAVAVSIPISRRGLIKTPLIIAAAASLFGSAGLATLDARAAIPLVIAMTLIIGLTVGLGSVSNQAAMYAQAPPDELGTSAGLLRTVTYIGAILSASVIGLVFQQRATDHGLHTLALLLGATSAVVLLMTIFDRALPPTLAGSPRPDPHAD